MYLGCLYYRHFKLSTRNFPPIISIYQFQKRLCLVHMLIPELTTMYCDWLLLQDHMELG